MKSLIFTDQNNTVNVEFVTDLINANAQNFTVMAIKGLATAWEKTNFNFKSLPYNLAAFKSFASANDLKLTLVSYQGAGSSTVLVNHTGEEENSGLGVDGI